MPSSRENWTSHILIFATLNDIVVQNMKYDMKVSQVLKYKRPIQNHSVWVTNLCLISLKIKALLVNVLIYKEITNHQPKCSTFSLLQLLNISFITNETELLWRGTTEEGSALHSSNYREPSQSHTPNYCKVHFISPPTALKYPLLYSCRFL